MSCSCSTPLGSREASLDKRDLVVVSLKKCVRTLGLPTGELVAGGLLEQNPHFNERDQIGHTVPFEFSGQRAGPWRHDPEGARSAGR